MFFMPPVPVTRIILSESLKVKLHFDFKQGKIVASRRVFLIFYVQKIFELKVSSDANSRNPHPD